MPRKKKLHADTDDADAEPQTTVKVSLAIVKKLRIIATHRNTNVMKLVEPVLRDFAEREYPKAVGEMHKEL